MSSKSKNIKKEISSKGNRNLATDDGKSKKDISSDAKNNTHKQFMRLFRDFLSEKKEFFQAPGEDQDNQMRDFFRQ